MPVLGLLFVVGLASKYCRTHLGVAAKPNTVLCYSLNERTCPTLWPATHHLQLHWYILNHQKVVPANMTDTSAQLIE